MAGFTRRFNGGRFAASRFNGQRRGERAPEIITADTAPQLAAADDADTPADVFTAGTYSSSAGTISDVITTYLVNGSAEASSHDLAAGDTLQVTQLVTDSAGNSRTFSTGVVTVTPSVALSNTGLPEITGTPAVGETLSVTDGTWNGSAPRTYGYQWTRDGADISGATSSTYTLVGADADTDVGCAVTADDGFTEVTASAAAVTVAAAPVDTTISLASIEALYTDPTTRGQQGAPNKTVGVDALPSGASISGSTVNWSGDIDWSANGDKWDFNDHSLTIQSTATGSLRNFLLTEPANSGWIRLIDIYAGAQIDTIEWGTFRGAGADSTVGSIIGMRTSGTGAAATAPAIAMIQRNAFFGMSFDGIKSTCGGIRRYNYFDTPVNLPYEPPVWASGDTYDTGELATDPTGQYVFRSLVDNNTTQPPGSKTSTTEWENIDPHADQDNPYAVIGSELEIYANYYNRSNANRLEGAPGYGWGINNSIRTNLNTGSDLPHLKVKIHRNVIAGGEELQSYPVQLDSGVGHPNWMPDELIDNWITPNSGGLFYHPDSDNGTNVLSGTISYTQRVRAFVAAVIGQSENEVGWVTNDSYYTQGPYPALVSGANAQIAIQAASDKNGTDVIRTLDQAAVTGRDVSPGFVALANLWHVGSGGRPIRLVDVVVPGTSANDMLDEDDADRDTAADISIIAAAQAEFGLINSVTYNWWNAEAATAKTFWESRSAHLLGINQDGTDYDFAAGPLDHCVIDTTGQGFGLFPDTAKLHLMLPGQRIDAAVTEYAEPHVNYRTLADGSEIYGMIDQNAVPAVQERKDFVSDTPAANRGLATITPAVSRFGDYAGGAQLPAPAQTSIHPSMQSADGQQLFSQHVAMSFLISEGHYSVPRHLRTEFASDGSYADLVFGLPNGGTLSTTRKVRGGTVTSPRPHQQLDGMGVVIYRDGDTDRTARPLFRPGEADAVAAYRGTVAIHDAGSNNGGTREAVLRITPEVAFANGDAVHFGTDGGYGGFILYGYPDYDAHMYLDALIEHVPALYSGAQYPGIPVEPQVISTASGIGAASWSVTGGENAMTINSAPTVAAPTATGGVNQITITE